MTGEGGAVDPAKLQHVKGWRRGLSEYELHAALDRLAVRPASGDPEAWAAYYASAVEALRLPGHEDGVDQALAAAQLDAEFAGAARFSAVWQAIGELEQGLGQLWYRHPTEPWLIDDFLGESILVQPGPQAGQLDKAMFPGKDLRQFFRSWWLFRQGWTCLRVAIPSLGYVGGLSWADVAPFQSDDGNWDAEALDLEFIDAGHMHDLSEALENALAAKGLYRGPCESCGFQRWPVPWRARAYAMGRPRLSDTLCPACEVVQLRKRQASKVRRSRW